MIKKALNNEGNIRKGSSIKLVELFYSEIKNQKIPVISVEYNVTNFQWSGEYETIVKSETCIAWTFFSMSEVEKLSILLQGKPNWPIEEAVSYLDKSLDELKILFRGSIIGNKFGI